MDMYQIRYFLAVVDGGNFSRAAERVHVTQPTLSTGIKKLEDELGVALFERTNREVKLTAAGEQFVKRARAISREMEDARDEMRSTQSNPVLRIGVLRSLAMEPVAEMTHDFRRLHPEVLIELTDGSDDDLRLRLRLDQLDLAITVLRTADKPGAGRIFVEEALHLAMRDDHPLARRRSVSLREVDKQPFIERVNCEVWASLHEEFERSGIQPHNVYRAESDQAVITLIASGLGVSIMPVRRNTQGVRFIPVADLAIKRRIGLLWQEGSRSRPLEEFRRFAEDKAPAIADRGRPSSDSKAGPGSKAHKRAK